MPPGPKQQPPRRGRELFAAESSIFKDQLGLATRAQLIAQGLSRDQIRRAVRQGRWACIARGVYALASWPAEQNRQLLAVCLATGGVASHASAAWVWGLLEREPSPLTVTVPHGRTPDLVEYASQNGDYLFPGPSGAVIYHSREFSERYISVWRRIPTTRPLRTLVDLAGVAGPELVDGAIDVALSRRLLTIDGLTAEAARLKQRGRRGPAQLMASLQRRGFVGAPAPSVLESRALRLLKKAGIKVLKCETVVEDGRYRLDIQLEAHLFLELDGYAYHWSPEHKSHDDTRRNQLSRLGHEILVYDWRTVMRDGRRFVSEVKAAVGSRKEKGA